MVFKKINQKMIVVWRVRKILSSIFWLVIGVVGINFTFNWSPWFNLILIIVLILNIYYLPKLEYKQWKYFISDEMLYIEHGIFFLKTKIIPIRRIQHLIISKGLILKHYDLVKLKIYVASGEFQIEGLLEEEAMQIARDLNQKIHLSLEEELEVIEDVSS